MKLQSINRVRCHLQVLSLADIVTGDGKNIGGNYLRGIPSKDVSRWEWHKEEPCQNDYKTWNKYISKITEANGVLALPLGEWIAKPHQRWTWFHDKIKIQYINEVETGGDYTIRQ